MMQKFTFVLTVAAFVLGTAAFQASAQNQRRGLGAIYVLKNATAIIKKAACDGSGGLCGCSAGRIDACWERKHECCGVCVPC
jgi:hypothetical protein